MDQTQQRLITLFKLWGAVKFFHPYLAYRNIDWDGALIAAIPKVKAADDAHAFAEAVGGMLAALGDPASRILWPEPEAETRGDDPRPLLNLGDDGVLLVNMTNYKNFESVDEALTQLNAIEAKLPEAKAVIFDLRVRVASAANEWVAYLFDTGIAQLLCSDAVVAPGERTRVHLGFAAQGGGSTSYCSAFVTRDGRRIARSATAPRLPIVFVVDGRSVVPAPVLALQDAGLAAIVAEEGWNDAALVRRHAIELEAGIQAEIRLGELLRADGSAGVAANIGVTASADGTVDAALEAALALARNFAPPKPPLTHPPAAAAPLPEADYAEMTYPSTEYRLLALARIHAVIDYFFPYKDLMEDDWDVVLAAFIPRFDAAADALQYNLAIAEMLTHTRDSHVRARSAVLLEHIGEGAPPMLVRWAEGAVVITGLPDAEAADGVSIGDIVLSVDGEPVEALMARIGRLVTASTPQAQRRVVLGRLLCGPRDSEVRLTLRGADGQEKQASLRRTVPAGSQDEARGETLRWLPGNIGYADLDRLKRSEVDAMFEKFASAKAIIFDMRGYPDGTAWAIAPRLAEHPQPPAARFERPRVSGPVLGG